MAYVYSAKNNSFYSDELRDAYEAAGTWPGFFVRIPDDEYQALMAGLSKGKMIAPDGNARPVLMDRPPLPQSELIAQAEEQRKLLTDEAMQSVTVLQLKLLSGRKLSDEEAVKLNLVLDYIDRLGTVKTEDAPDIVWPEAPAYVA